MPIRFRCTYCNQLMGIARRKAGTQVQCPTCKARVVVPGSSSEAAPVAGGPPPALAFELNDFDDFLKGPTVEEPSSAAAGASPQQPGPLVAPSPFEADVEPLRPMPGALAPLGGPNEVGILLSPAKATLLTVMVILGLALAFSAGLVVGRLL